MSVRAALPSPMAMRRSGRELSGFIWVEFALNRFSDNRRCAKMQRKLRSDGNEAVAHRAHHEYMADRGKVKAPSEKSFGVTFASVFALLSAWQFYRHGMAVGPVATTVAALGFLAAAFAAPTVLRPLNLLWSKFGILLHRVVNPLIMGLLFFFVFTPIGVAMRLFGADPLRLRKKTDANSYWIVRAEENVEQSSMNNQF